MALSGNAGAGNQPYALAGGMPQEAKALGNARDMLTWGRYMRRHGCSMGKGLMAGVG